MKLVWRGRGPRFETNAKWLTASAKQFLTRDTTQRRVEELWGVKNDADLSQGFGRYLATVRYEMVQASRFSHFTIPNGDHHLYARRWRTDGTLMRSLGEHASVSLRYFYQERTQVYRPPISNVTQNVIDRMPMVESSFLLTHTLGMRVGFMRNRITVDNPGGTPTGTYGTRVETRAFFCLRKKFGKVWIQGTECIELDKEPYPVTFHHDKGFVHIQTTF
jgi:hypothetical protein